MSDYNDRKDIDYLLRTLTALVNDLNEKGVTNISELLDNYYDQSEVDGSITKIDGDISSVQEDIDTVQNTTIPAVKSKMGYDNIPTGENLQEQISTEKGRVDTINDTTIPNVKTRMGYNDIDVTFSGNLQTQLFDIIQAVLDMFPVIHVVDSIDDVCDGEFPYAPPDYPYIYVYAKDTGKYYELVQVGGAS